MGEAGLRETFRRHIEPTWGSRSSFCRKMDINPGNFYLWLLGRLSSPASSQTAKFALYDHHKTTAVAPLSYVDYMKTIMLESSDICTGFCNDAPINADMIQIECDDNIKTLSEIPVEAAKILEEVSKSDNPCEGLELEFQLHVADTFAHCIGAGQPVDSQILAIGMSLMAKTFDAVNGGQDDMFEAFDAQNQLLVFSYFSKFPSQSLESATDPGILDAAILPMCQSIAVFLTTHGLEFDEAAATQELVPRFADHLAKRHNTAIERFEKCVKSASDPDWETQDMAEYLSREHPNREEMRAAFWKDTVWSINIIK